MNNDILKIEEDLNEIANADAKKSRIIAGLLDEVSKKQNKFFATRGEMGMHQGLQGRLHRTPSYVVSHDLAWIASNVNMGSDMPFMKNAIKNGKLELDSKNIDEIQQRMPDWSRQAELSAYLAHNTHRKFGTILAVVSPGWINDDKHEYWGADGRALRGAINYEPLDSEGHIGLLNLDRAEVSVYALDGQHRVMGLKGLLDLQGNKLYLKDKIGTPLTLFSRDDFYDEIGLNDSSLQSLLGERMHVEYIPAILPGETRKEAVRRIRSVFFSLNAYAKKPTKGETLLLSETDGNAIVARRVGITHPLLRPLRGEQAKDRVNWKSSALPDGSEWLTTLEALKAMVEGVMKGMRPDLVKAFSLRLNKVELRPNDDELDQASIMFEDFLNHLLTLPVIHEIDSSDDPSKELAHQRSFDSTGKGHLFLRPIGQEILAKAIGELIEEGMGLGQIFNVIQELDRNGRFQANDPRNVWYGVTFDFHKNKMDIGTKNRSLAVKLLKYLVRGADEVTRRTIESELLPYRVIDASTLTWRNFSGETSKYEIMQGESVNPVLTSKDMALPTPRK